MTYDAVGAAVAAERRACIRAVCAVCARGERVDHRPESGGWVHWSQVVPGVPIPCPAGKLWEREEKTP